MEEYCIGSERPHRIVVLEKEEENNKQMEIMMIMILTCSLYKPQPNTKFTIVTLFLNHPVYNSFCLQVIGWMSGGRKWRSCFCPLWQVMWPPWHLPQSCELAAHFDLSCQLDSLTWGVTEYNKTGIKYVAKAPPRPPSCLLFLFLHKRPIYGKLEGQRTQLTCQAFLTLLLLGLRPSRSWRDVVCPYIPRAGTSGNQLRCRHRLWYQIV